MAAALCHFPTRTWLACGSFARIPKSLTKWSVAVGVGPHESGEPTPPSCQGYILNTHLTSMMCAGRAMRWWHFGAAAAAVGIGIVALTGNVAAQTSTQPDNGSTDTREYRFAQRRGSSGCTTPVNMPRRFRWRDGHSHSARRRWGPTTPPSASSSTTWPGLARAAKKRGTALRGGWCPASPREGREAPRRSHSSLMGFELHKRGAKGASAKNQCIRRNQLGHTQNYGPGSEVDTRAKDADG
jgi:hypothetical protein